MSDRTASGRISLASKQHDGNRPSVTTPDALVSSKLVNARSNCGMNHGLPRYGCRWLGVALPDTVFEGIRVVTGQPLGEPQDFDGYVITGSKHGAYDDLPWIPPLEEFIRECARAHIPVFGICFDHRFWRGVRRSRRSERGWGVGVQRYEIKGYPADGSIGSRLPPGPSCRGA